MTIGFYEILVLVFRSLIVAFNGLYEEREQYLREQRSRCFQLLPLELVAQVVESLESDKIDQRESSVDRQKALATCARTSSWLSRFAEPQLFERPYLTHHLERFERTLRLRLDMAHRIQQVVIDLRDDPLPSLESAPAAKAVALLGSRTKTVGLMEVREVQLGHLAYLPQLERLHLHFMNYATHHGTSLFHPPISPCPPFFNLTSLSLSCINLPYPAGDSSPVSEIYVPDILPNLNALELDECCVRIVSKANNFPLLKYFALRCSCVRCLPELELNSSLIAPLELFELNPQPLFLAYFRHHSDRLPKFKRLRLASEFFRFRSNKTATFSLAIIIDALRNKPYSPLKHLIQLSLPNYWENHPSPEVYNSCLELLALAKKRDVQVDFDVYDEGSRVNRATRAACFSSDFWQTVERIKASTVKV